jgi:two-component system, oxyanion-binding sensor
MWFSTRFKRWGLLKEDPDYLAIETDQSLRVVSTEAVSQFNEAVPADVMRSGCKVWEGKDPQGYAASLEAHASDKK